MLNQVILIGILSQQYTENDDIYIALRVDATPRSTRGNSDDGYDIVPCRIGNNLKELKQHLKLGVLIGVKAKITTHKDTDKITIDAQKITLISSESDNDEQ